MLPRSCLWVRRERRGIQWLWNVFSPGNSFCLFRCLWEFVQVTRNQLIAPLKFWWGRLRSHWVIGRILGCTCLGFIHVLRWRKKEIYYRDILVSLAFVALAQCKHRHYSALATYLSLEIPVVLILDVFQQQKWIKAVCGIFMHALSSK